MIEELCRRGTVCCFAVGYCLELFTHLDYGPCSIFQGNESPFTPLSRAVLRLRAHRGEAKGPEGAGCRVRAKQTSRDSKIWRPARNTRNTDTYGVYFTALQPRKLSDTVWGPSTFASRASQMATTHAMHL